MGSRIEAIRKRVAGTTIDPATLLSTDYFNHFNEAIMLIGMLPEMPEMLDDVDAWQFRTYCQHFRASGLGIAPLAIDAYAAAPALPRKRLDELAAQMSLLIVETRARLRALLARGELAQFRRIAELHALELQGMVDGGGAIIHGQHASADQSAVDALF